MQKLKSVGRTAVLLLLGLVLGLNLYLWNARNLVGNAMPMPFGYGAAVVLSGSMEPTFSAGDLIIVMEPDALAVGDIVVYQDSGSLVVHRIIAMDGEILTTQGDANNAPDSPVSASAVKGKVLFWIPYVGNIVNVLKTPAGIIGVIAAAIALIELPRRREQKKDEETRQQIIDEILRLKQQQEHQE